MLDIWLEWLEDEQALLEVRGQKLSQTAFERIHALYEKAVTDFLSVNVWLSWADFMESAVVESLEAAQSNDREDPPRVTFDTVREFYESALERLEGHLSRAGEIWARYRAFEDLVSSVAEASEETAMVERKRTIFHRELAHPHKDLQKMYDEEYLPWERTVGDAKAPASDASHAEVLKLLGSSLEEYRRRQDHEAILTKLEQAYEETHTPDYTKLDALRKYLKYEQSHSPNSSGRVTCLYERIISMFFLAIDMWQSYTQTLLKAPSKHNHPTAKLEAALAVLRRSVRSYPYTRHMWCQLMLALEQYGNLTGNTPEVRTEILEVFERALQAGLTTGQELLAVYLQYLDYRVRAITNWTEEAQTSALTKAFEAAHSYFESFLPDLTFDFEEYWSTMAMTKMQNVTLARSILETSLNRDTAHTHHWLAYVKFELLQADADRAREVYKRAAAVASLDAPERLWSQWLDFERAFGTLDSFLFASEKVEKKERDLAIKNAALAAKHEAALAAADEELGPRKGGGRKQQKSAQHSETPEKAPRKRNNRKLAKGADGEAVIPSKENEESQSHNKHGAPHNKPQVNYDPTTLHVGGLPASPELLELVSAEQLSALFESFGAITGVRFPLDTRTGQRKGFAYVQFADAASSKAVRASIKDEKRQFTLELPIGTGSQFFPLRVNAAVASKPHKVPGAKKAAVDGLEEYKHTVFVSNLSALTTLAKLEAFLSTSGSPLPVAVRMPTDRKTGASRCIAYLDFDGPELVVKATEALNGQMLDARRLHAAPSAPTKERAPHPPPSTPGNVPTGPGGIGALGGKAAQDAEQHAASLSSQPKFVPRSVAMRGGNSGPKARIAPLSKPQSSKMDMS